MNTSQAIDAWRTPRQHTALLRPFFPSLSHFINFLDRSSIIYRDRSHLITVESPGPGGSAVRSNAQGNCQIFGIYGLTGAAICQLIGTHMRAMLQFPSGRENANSRMVLHPVGTTLARGVAGPS